MPAEDGFGRKPEVEKEDAADSRQQSDLSDAGSAPAANQGVTYRLHHDLLLRYQGQVIDRNTEETVRSIPSDERIEIARKFQAQVGRFLDRLA